MFVSCECLCCQVEVSATGRSLVQRSPTDCCVCVWVWSSEKSNPLHRLWHTYVEEGRTAKRCNRGMAMLNYLQNSRAVTMEACSFFVLTEVAAVCSKRCLWRLKAYLNPPF
jgi:hypothetical protein